MRSRTQRLVMGVVMSAALLGFSRPAFAQGIGIGVKGGPLFSSFRDTNGQFTFKRRTGFMGGLFIGGHRSGPVGIMTEINFLKRSSVDPDGNDINLYSVQVPVFARFNIGQQSKNGFNLYVLVGPAIDVRFKANSTVGGITTDIKDQTESYDASIIGAVGFEYARIILEGRYTEGFRNLAKNLESSTKIKARTFALLVGVRFN